MNRLSKCLQSIWSYFSYLSYYLHTLCHIYKQTKLVFAKYLQLFLLSKLPFARYIDICKVFAATFGKAFANRVQIVVWNKYILQLFCKYIAKGLVCMGSFKHHDAVLHLCLFVNILTKSKTYDITRLSHSVHMHSGLLSKTWDYFRIDSWYKIIRKPRNSKRYMCWNT